MPERSQYYAHGKLLITGEYLVLNGAKALAVPLRFGQKLEVSDKRDDKNTLYWQAFHPSGLWFEGFFDTTYFSPLDNSDEIFAHRLSGILRETRKLAPGFLKGAGAEVKTFLEFNPQYGFGSSSTLIVDLASWAGVDPFELQKRTFKGSGYDIACGISDKPIVYALNGDQPEYEQVKFDPPFTGNIYFVYLGKKQRSMEEVRKFKNNAKFALSDIRSVSEITQELITVNMLDDFEKLLREHEDILSKILKTEPVSKKFFGGYKGGVVKSLGAWGGDFVLITSKKDKKEFMREISSFGFKTVYTFKDLVI
jgi:mevalonate kinase